MVVYETGIIESSLNNCDDIDELKQTILPLLKDQRSMWTEKIEQILSDKGYSCKKLAQLCRVSEPAVRKWRKGSLPQSRDMYIRIGFAAGYNKDEMNSFLKRYGKCPQLYVKSLEDSVCMFVLESDTLDSTYETYERVLGLVKQELHGVDCGHQSAYTTGNLSEYFASLKNLDEMINFAKTFAPSFKQAYAKLYSFIIAYLAINLGNEYVADGDGGKASFHSMATEAQWSSSLRHCISEIRNKRWFPLRHKIISLGLHLNMDADAINRTLQLAQMEPLYVKNPIEASIMWAIEEAKLCSEDDAIIPDGSSDLCDFVKSILVQLDLAEEGNYLIEDL